MNQQTRGAISALALAATLAGCGANPVPGAPADPPVLDSAGEQVVDAAGAPVRFGLLSATALVPTAVTASTTENAYHPASHAWDKNVSTAWAPLWNDAAPALTFTFGGEVNATAFTTRTTPTGVSIAVAIWNGSGWTTIKSGLQPPTNVSTRYTLAGLPTTKVKLSYTGVRASDLYVCEVAFEGGKALCEATSF